MARCKNAEVVERGRRIQEQGRKRHAAFVAEVEAGRGAGERAGKDMAGGGRPPAKKQKPIPEKSKAPANVDVHMAEVAETGGEPEAAPAYLTVSFKKKCTCRVKSMGKKYRAPLQKIESMIHPSDNVMLIAFTNGKIRMFSARRFF